MAIAREVGRDQALQKFLSDEIGPAYPCLELEQPTKYAVSWIDLNADGRPEALVYVFGRSSCGSGGCELYVLERTKTGFRKRAEISITNPPIAVLRTTSNGWRDIAVRVRGGGATPGYDAALRFDGRAYPDNPSVEPAEALHGRPPRDVVFGADAWKAGTRLFSLEERPPPPVSAPGGSVTVSGNTVEVSLPDPGAECWIWRNIPAQSPVGLLRYMTGKIARQPDGSISHIWVYSARGPGKASVEFVLVPGWKNIFGDEQVRAAAAKVWRAEVVVP